MKYEITFNDGFMVEVSSEKEMHEIIEAEEFAYAYHGYAVKINEIDDEGTATLYLAKHLSERFEDAKKDVRDAKESGKPDWLIKDLQYTVDNIESDLKFFGNPFIIVPAVRKRRRSRS